jgi:Fe-S oxidoreductase/nitrate reductase gamma subunit
LNAIAQPRTIQRLYPGVMHFMIFWGMTIQVIGTIINILQYPLFLPFDMSSLFPLGGAYQWFELVMDIGGAMIILGVLMALARRLFFKPDHLPTRWDDWYALGLLLLIVLIGFASEGVRLLAVDPSWRQWSPIGNVVAGWLAGAGLTTATSEPLHQFLFWAHAGTGMLLVASLPFTKLRHIVTGPLNILARPESHKGSIEPIDDIEEAEKLGAGEIQDFTTQSLLSFDACVQCGRCEEVCPATIAGMDYSPTKLIHSLFESMHVTLVDGHGSAAPDLLPEFVDPETTWSCTTCGHCVDVCPLFVNPISAVVELRRYLTLMTGEVPNSVGETLTQMERRGNPWGLPAEQHAPWVKELNVRILQPGDSTDVLLFVGCAIGYDARSQQIGKSFAQLLQKAGVDFAVLGAAEGCCGETARRLGHEYVFQVMAQENIETLNTVKFNRIVSACAHCFNTLKNEYPQFGGQYEVIHHSQLLSEMVSQGKIPSAQANGETFTMHDPCYLGRYNQIYDEPRVALEDLPQSEMKRSKASGFCCGGGGGQMWLETDPSTRINNTRIMDIVEAEAEVVATACPYCLIMFEDAIGAKNLSEKVQAKDIAEILNNGQSS